MNPALLRTLFPLGLLSAVLSMGCDNAVREIVTEVRPSAVFNPIGFATDYLFSKVVDGIWDDVTGKPDVRELDRKLQEVEARLAAHDPELGKRIGRLREDVTENTTREEYLSLARSALADLEQRVADLEKQNAELKERNEAVDKKLDEVLPEFREAVNGDS